MIKATVLVDNIAPDSLIKEWGLSIHIEYDDRKVLLDTGASGRYLKNAESLGIDIEDVDYGVLSHAHYDHADGMDRFFSKNQKASFYLRKGSGENCYGKMFIFRRYIGIRKGMLSAHEERIVYVEGDCELSPGIFLIPHKTEGLSEIGKKNRMYVRGQSEWLPDDFRHEQSLVFDTDQGLVIFNSCSHGGADNIIREVSGTFPGKRICALVGGFHLYHTPEAEVRALSGRIRDTGIQQIYTGHCTGENAYSILREELGDMARQLHAGLVIEI